MSSNLIEKYPIIDMHVHVGLRGDKWPVWGMMSQEFRTTLVYKIFLMYARIKEDEVCDAVLRTKALDAIATSRIDRAVCLALDPVYSRTTGLRMPSASHLWVDNEYILELQRELPNRILLGASVHPYDPQFKRRVRTYVDKGAVLLKWLPSAQQIDLADVRVRDALEFLATANCDGSALPLLLHCGPEYAIPSTDPKATSYNFLHWSTWDAVVNSLRLGKKWYTPNVAAVVGNLEHGLKAGAIIIFAHCGLPYFFSGFLSHFLEHSEFDQVANFLARNATGEFRGRCYADVSALVTPFRKAYFSKVRGLPDDYLVYGSDFPTPVFELSADAGEMLADFEAVLGGHLDRVVVPQDNLIDVHLRELRNFFPGSSAFTNFSRILGGKSLTGTARRT